MRELVLTPKFKRAFRKFLIRNRNRQKILEEILEQMSEDLFAAHLGTHKLSGQLSGLYACICGYDCRIVFSIEKKGKITVKLLCCLILERMTKCIEHHQLL